jgi:hypothetical protein
MTERHPELDGNGLAPWRRLEWFVRNKRVPYKSIAEALGVAPETVKAYVNGYKSHSFSLPRQEQFSQRWLDPQQFPGAKKFFTAFAADDKALEDLLYGRSHVRENRMSSPAGDSTMWFLVARPAQDNDIDGILAIAQEENIASMTCDRAARLSDIERSRETIAKERQWTSGGLFLVTRFLDDAHPSGEVAGCSKLTIGKGGFWTKKHLASSGGGHSVRIEYLAFEVLKEKALELGGNYVLTKYRGNQADQQSEPKEAVFLFYEEVVRPLLGGLSYEDADALRYKDEWAVPQLLVEDAHDHLREMRLPRHLIRSYGGLGLVRKKTKPAEEMWKKRGFHNEKNRFDALDGGLILECKFSTLKSQFQNERRELLAVRAKNTDLIDDPPATEPSERSKWYNFAPVRRDMKEFVCGRAYARIKDNSLLIDEGAFNELDLSKNEPIWVIVRHSTQAKRNNTGQTVQARSDIGSTGVGKPSYTVGSFNADARVLFLMMNEASIFDGRLNLLFTNLLTEKRSIEELSSLRQPS